MSVEQSAGLAWIAGLAGLVRRKLLISVNWRNWRRNNRQ
jgi:hypothetical protein